MRLIALGVLWFFLAAAPQETFEVASVKPSAQDATGMFIRVSPGGDLRVAGASLKGLIAYAYGVRPFQVSGGPKWIDTARFDIEAKAATSDAAVSGEQRKTGERLRSLLADRFQLTLHPDTKEQPVFTLVVAKGGAKVQESTESGNSIRRIGRGELRGQSVGMGMLVVNLSNELERPVIDNTGLKGKYSFDLKWSPDQPQPTDSDGPSIFTALQEQLGLRLESTKGPVKVLVIDGAATPSKN